MAVASLVLGIIALVLNFIPFVSYVGVVLAIVGLVLAVVAQKNEPEKMATAKAGMICCIVALILRMLFFVACAACVTSCAFLPFMY